MLLATNALKELDDSIYFDFEEFPPDGIPKDHEWQREGLGDLLFNNEKKKKAMQRSVFNFGVMSGLAQNYFDGKGSEFDKFLNKAVLSAVASAKVVMVAAKYAKKYPKEFATGVNWSKGFITRHSL